VPYAPAFVRALRARAHGEQLDDPRLNKIGRGKAREMLKEAGQLTGGTGKMLRAKAAKRARQ